MYMRIIVFVSSDKITYLSNVTYDIQSQLNKCQPKCVALDPLEQIIDNEVVGNEILENHFLGLSQTFLNTVNGKQDLLNKGSNITVNVGRGNVYLENNANDNVNGSGLTLRTSSNPGNGGGNIFGVRSSDQICRLWVGNEITTPGDNSFYCGYTGVTGSESNKANYRHSFTNTAVILGTPVTCQYDLSCSTLTAASIYGGAAIQIQNNIDAKIEDAVTNKIVQAPAWVAFRAFGTGSVMRSYGQNTITTSNVDTSGGTGTYKVTMPTHPLGANYGVIASATNGGATVISCSVQSATQFTVSIFNMAGTPANAQFTVQTVG